MEDPSRAPPTPETAEKQHAAADRAAGGVRRSASAAASSSNNFTQRAPETTDLDRSYADVVAEYAADSGEFENDPVCNADVVRESDRSNFAEIPEHGSTRGLLARFQNRQ